MHRVSPPVSAFCAAVAALLIATPSAAAPAHLWSQSFGTSGASSRGYGIATDASGNVLLTGSFNGTVNFGGDDLVAQGTDVVIARYNAFGAHVWSRRVGGTMADQAYAVALDGSGNVFVTGYFQGTTNFGGGNLTSNGISDIFVAKYDPSGNHLWSRALGTNDADIGYSLATDNAGYVTVTGYLHGITPSDIVIARYNPTGTLQWLKALGSAAGYDEGLSVAADGSGNILVTGSFSGTVDFGGGNLSTPGDDWDVFIVKYNAAGTHLWSRRFGDTDLEEGTAIKPDNSGNVFVTGYFKGSVDFGGGPLVSVGDEVDVFLAKYDPNGAHQWSRRMGGDSYENACALSVDGNSNVFVAGYFDGTASFGGGDLLSQGSIDIFFAQYAADGTYLSSQRFGGAAGDAAQSITIDGTGNQYLTGYFDDVVDFGGGDLVSSGTPDMFIVKYGHVVSAVDPHPALDALSISAVPNPFNPSTTIRYETPSPGHVSLTVYDIRGRRVATLLDQDEPAGVHTVPWNGRDRTGQASASGIYFARLVHAGEMRTFKLVLLK